VLVVPPLEPSAPDSAVASGDDSATDPALLLPVVSDSPVCTGGLDPPPAQPRAQAQPQALPEVLPVFWVMPAAPPQLVLHAAVQPLLVTVIREAVVPPSSDRDVHVHRGSAEVGAAPAAARQTRSGLFSLFDTSPPLSAAGSGGASGAASGPSGGGAFSAGGCETLAAPAPVALLAQRLCHGSFPDDHGVRLPIERPD